MFGTMPVPKETGVFLAKGNTATCEFQGFFNQLTTSNMFYNAFLMLLFVQIVRYGAKEETLSKTYSNFIHIVCIGIPIVCGVSGVFLEVFNPVGDLGMTRCYIAPYPPYCDADDSTVECTRGEHYVLFLVLFGLDRPYCH